ncbi:MAG: protein kinase [Deltaproteobacteria bacterium]|nr:protein kinase [Deltaproteobacteria bacterium]
MSNLVFGKYEILRRLAVGGMGEVFLARQTGIGGFDRRVILKSLLPDLADNEDFVNQFLDEARVAATLNHPNIVAIYEVGKWSGTYFIAMEYIRGANLGQISKRLRKEQVEWPIAVAARIIHDACVALDHAHHALDSQGRPLSVVHRDISPQNIMVRSDGVTKVVDFGIAKATNKMARTATGILKGKYPYMSPEQVQTLELDGRSDQFSLGVVFWEMLARQRLFKAATEIETLKQVLQRPIPTLESVLPGFPADLSATVHRMLARDRTRRFDRLADAAQEIGTYLETCSFDGKVGAVGTFLAEVVPEDDPKLMNTPSSTGNFVIPLNPVPEGSQGGVPGPSEAIEAIDIDLGATSATPPPGLDGIGKLDLSMDEPAPKRGRAGLFVGLLVLAGLAGGGYVLTRGSGPEGSEPSAKDGGAPATAVKAAPGVRIRPAATPGELKVEQPEGAKLYVDGEPWPEVVPTVLSGLKAGRHQLRFELPDGRQVEDSVEVAAPAAPKLAVSSQPGGATVKVDGVERGQTPLTVEDLAPGAHELVLALAGHDDHTQEVVLEAGMGSNLSIALKKSPKQGRRGKRRPRDTGAATVSTGGAPPPPPPPPPAVGDGYVTVNTKPWTKVSVNGTPWGTTPLFKRKLPAGKHTMRFVNEGEGIDVTRRIDVRAGQNEKVSFDFAK